MPSTITAGTTSGTSLNFSGDTSGVLTVQGVTMGNGGVGAGNATRFKNRIINGDMRIDQRFAGASVATSSGTFTYTLDRWLALYSATSKYTIQQNAGSVTPPTGFINYLGVTSSSSYSVSSGDYFYIGQRVEGLNVADLGWGTANAKTVTLSCWVCSSLTGTFGGAVQNSANNRSYPFSYSIPVANTWTQISITIAGDTTGTWLTTNGTGLQIIFSLGMGSTYSTTAGAWTAGNYASATGATSVLGTLNATFYITGVQLEVGSSATGFEYVDYGTQLAMCQRYYELFSGGGYIGTGSSGSFYGWGISFKQEKRTSPTVTRISNVSIGNMNSPYSETTTVYGTRCMAQASAGGPNQFTSNYSADSEL